MANFEGYAGAFYQAQTLNLGGVVAHLCFFKDITYPLLDGRAGDSLVLGR